MGHRLTGASAATAAAAVLMLPTAALAEGGHEHDASPDDHTLHAPVRSENPHDHGQTTTDDSGHTDHGTDPDSVSPEVRNLVLSGFAGVNVAVVFGAWLMRRTGPDPDPRKRAPKAPR